MANFKMHGDQLREGSKTIANVRGNQIREGSGINTIANVRGNEIRKGSGINIIANVRGDEIRAGNGMNKIGTITQARKEIGAANTMDPVMVAAFWLCFVKRGI